MQIHIFTLPLSPSDDDLESVNKFLRSHRIMTVDRHYSADNGGYWTLFVTYQENGSPEAPLPVVRSSKKDYREILNVEQFDRFAKMRDLRRNLLQKEAKPAYAIFTDEELANIAQLSEVTVATIRQIKGVGKRADKYGPLIIETLLSTPEQNETDRTGDAPYR